MTLGLHNLTRTTHKTKKRVGRGNGSTGTYSGRGQKGQRSRSGGKSGLALRGFKQNLQNIPKTKGFTSLEKKPWSVVIGKLEKLVKDGDIITPRLLEKRGIVQHTRRGIKLVAGGVFSKKVTLKNIATTKSVQELIEKNGGTIK